MQRAIKKIGLIFLALFMLLTVCACAPSSIKAAQKHLKREGYTVTAVKEYGKDSDEYIYEGKKGYITAKETFYGLGWKLEAHLFVSGAVANEHYDELNIPSSAHVNKKGGWIAWGDQIAVELFLKNM